VKREFSLYAIRTRASCRRAEVKKNLKILLVTAAACRLSAPTTLSPLN
jgi:hypothetical protein